MVAVLVSDLWAMAGKNGSFFLTIGRHLESVSRTELIFELNLAPSEERPICEFRSDLGLFFMEFFFFFFFFY